MTKKRARKKGKKVDPIIRYKRSIQAQARGMHDRQRIDFYIHLLEESVRPEKNQATAKFDYLQGRIATLLKRLGYLWEPYLTEDQRHQAGFEPYFQLRTAKDRARFRRFIRDKRGPNAAKVAIIRQEVFVANPDVVGSLSQEERREFCGHYNMTRCKVQAATEKAREGR